MDVQGELETDSMEPGLRRFELEKLEYERAAVRFENITYLSEQAGSRTLHYEAGMARTATAWAPFLPRLSDALKRELKIDTTTSKTKAA